ncbi:hypothetical protein HDU98_009392 [Podochytrium sp. JEL0797]|nr:hypothetical protein HDU98_009392 [Podochytrium sp. JEL0797]
MGKEKEKDHKDTPAPRISRVTLNFVGFPSVKTSSESPSRRVIAEIPTNAKYSLIDLVLFAKRDQLADDEGVDSDKCCFYTADFAAIPSYASIGVLRDGESLVVAYNGNVDREGSDDEEDRKKDKKKDKKKEKSSKDKKKSKSKGSGSEEDSGSDSESVVVVIKKHDKHSHSRHGSSKPKDSDDEKSHKRSSSKKKDKDSDDEKGHRRSSSKKKDKGSDDEKEHKRKSSKKKGSDDEEDDRKDKKGHSRSGSAKKDDKHKSKHYDSDASDAKPKRRGSHKKTEMSSEESLVEEKKERRHSKSRSARDDDDPFMLLQPDQMLFPISDSMGQIFDPQFLAHHYPLGAADMTAATLFENIAAGITKHNYQPPLKVPRGSEVMVVDPELVNLSELKSKEDQKKACLEIEFESGNEVEWGEDILMGYPLEPVLGGDLLTLDRMPDAEIFPGMGSNFGGVEGVLMGSGQKAQVSKKPCAPPYTISKTSDRSLKKSNPEPIQSIDFSFGKKKLYLPVQAPMSPPDAFLSPFVPRIFIPAAGPGHLSPPPSSTSAQPKRQLSLGSLFNNGQLSESFWQFEEEE